MKTVLLTGGTGYIGSHTAVELLNGGYHVLLGDNLSNSDISVVTRIGEITGTTPEFCAIDFTKKEAVRALFSQYDIQAVIHFAGLKAVGESLEAPILYYRNNLDATLTLLEVMKEYHCKTLIFSSSATVYGQNQAAPFSEEMPTGGCTNPYGWTKYMIEQILQDAVRADPTLRVVLLRYFNPIGAHPSGKIGERPNGIPNNLMPYITQVAAGEREYLRIFGDDYPTPDGTGVRDYIHVVDLAKGHLAALQYAEQNLGCMAFNLGTGTGYSVLDVVHAFQNANGLTLPYKICPRRPGDIAVCYADPTRANQILGWQAEKTLEDMCRDAWNWQRHTT